MNKVLFGMLAASAVVPASVALACTSNGKEGIFPENNLYIPPSRSAIYSTTQEEFFNAVNKMQTHYSPIFEKLGLKYKVIADWDDGTVNAYADRAGKTAEVYMFGGLARHRTVISPRVHAGRRQAAAVSSA